MSLHLFVHCLRFQNAVSPVGSLLHPISLFHHIWPVAGFGAGWIAFLAYGLFRLAF